MTKEQYIELTESLDIFKYWLKDEKGGIPVFKEKEKLVDKEANKVLAGNTRLLAREINGSKLLENIKTIYSSHLNTVKDNMSYSSYMKRSKARSNRK